MRNGETPQHLISWAAADWLTSRVRSRSANSSDPMLRTVYFELINVLYANDGEVPADAEVVADLLLLPEAEVARCLPILASLHSIEIEDGVVRQPRVSKELERCKELSNKRRAAAQLRWDTGKPDSKRARETWLTPFGGAWTETLGGEPPWGEMAKALAPLRQKYPDLAERWSRYLRGLTESGEGRYASPTAFAKKPNLYGGPPRKEKLPRPAPAEADPVVAVRWRDAVEQLVLPPLVKKTWLDATDGLLVRDGVLVVAVPSKQHEEWMRQRAERFMAHYNDEVGPADRVTALTCVVVEEDDGIHDGGL